MPTTRDFEIIEMTWHHNRGQFIYTRHIGNDHDFEIEDGAVLEDIIVYNYKQMRSVLKEQGKHDIFVFRPMSLTLLPLDHFTPKQRVKLTTGI